VGLGVAAQLVFPGARRLEKKHKGFESPGTMEHDVEPTRDSSSITHHGSKGGAILNYQVG